MSEEINLTPQHTWLHHGARAFILQIIHFYYPKIAVQGQENLPADGEPAVYTSNHPNFMLDQVVLTLGLGRRIGCMGKSTFFAHPVSRLALEAFEAMPIYRKKDEGLPYGPNGDAAERNQHILAHCRKLLHQGRAFSIFPEGTTHSHDYLLPLQPGAARIVLEAEAEAGWLGRMRIVPVGLGYADKTQFRSSVQIVFGEPIYAKDYREQYIRDKQQAEQALTDQLAERIKAAKAVAQQRGGQPSADLEPEYTGLLAGLLAVTAPVAGLGLLAHWLPYQVAEPLTRRWFDARDTRAATGKMLTSLGLLILNWLFLALVVAGRRGIFQAGLFLLTAPLWAYLSLRWAEAGQQLIGRGTTTPAKTVG